MNKKVCIYNDREDHPCLQMEVDVKELRQQLQAAEQQNKELQEKVATLEYESENFLARLDQENEMGAEQMWSRLASGIEFTDITGNIYKIRWDSGDSSTGIPAGWECDEEFSTPEMVEEAIKDATEQLRADLAQREAEGEALRKAVEWMKQIAEFFAYKAPEQINAVKLIAAMGDTAKDALAKVKGHKNEWGEW